MNTVREAAQAALDAYEHRFGSTLPVRQRPREEVNLVGPIDAEMVALRAALTERTRLSTDTPEVGTLLDIMDDTYNEAQLQKGK